MLRRNRRRVIHCAATMLLAAVAACSDAPTSTPVRITPDAEPLRNTSLSPTVTNSGGTPLVSWNAVTGATSYTVRLVTTVFYTTWRGDSPGTVFRMDIGTTTGTSFLDTARTYTGDSRCTRPAEYPYGPNDTYTESYQYAVVAHLATGTSIQRVTAPIGECS
jgi:hypothetical protein